MPHFEGKIERIGIFELKDTQKKGYNADKTHSIACKIENGPSHWLSFGTVTRNPDRDLTWRRKINDKYEDIYEGAYVEFMYNVNDKGYWNPKMKTFEVKENGTQYPKAYDYFKAGSEQKQSSGSSGNSSPSPSSSGYKNTGVEVGHCLNAALNLINHDASKMKNSDDVIELAKGVHQITQDMKVSHREQNPSLSEYDAGARVGHAVLNACRVVNDLAQVQKAAQKILDSFVPWIEEHIKNLDKKEEIKPEPGDNSQEDQNLMDQDLGTDDDMWDLPF